MAVEYFASLSELPSAPVEPCSDDAVVQLDPIGRPPAALDRDEDGRFATSSPPSPPRHRPRIFPGL